MASKKRLTESVNTDDATEYSGAIDQVFDMLQESRSKLPNEPNATPRLHVERQRRAMILEALRLCENGRTAECVAVALEDALFGMSPRLRKELTIEAMREEEASNAALDGRVDWDLEDA